MPEEILCSPAELDVVGEAMDLEVRRFPFTIGYHGSTRTERARLVETVHRDLAARGLVEGSRFTPEFTEVLRLFARAPLTIALAGSDSGDHLTALAALEGRSALLAIQTGENISFRRCSTQAALRGLVALPPTLPAGTGEPVTVTESPKPDEIEDFSQFRVTRRMQFTPTAESLVAEVLGRPRTGAGYFVASARDRHGREKPVGSLTYLDTDMGRYAAVPGTGPRGEASATYRPWDQRYIEAHLSEILDTYG
ncbi:ESX secretion-associated protein EspG [Saccharothrix xinjiangensis]|uniref:ESX secretion-associated protein EspG n=1 Tax=Saccharothrix xinjiangensis TaxID=204798 RepID=UPI0031D7F772